MNDIAISATNPCHLYDLAVAIHAHGRLGRYISGYPRWRLKPASNFPLRAHSFRTVITYAARRLPAGIRPSDSLLFRWQDHGFDRAAARSLQFSDGQSVHAMPGQALETFRRANEMGMLTVLNHASGPVRQQLQIVEAEFDRARLSGQQHHAFDEAYFAQEAEEYALADFHCVASSVVQAQLIKDGVSAERIWTIPYAANPSVFFPLDPPPPKRHVIVFAGQINLRKGIRILLPAFRRVRATFPEAELHCYGSPGPELDQALPAWREEPGLKHFGPVSQNRLADAFRHAAALVLPSWEEAFGLVVPQALQCGTPCVVSDQVGAKDLINLEVNGTVFSAGDIEALADALCWWLRNPGAFYHQPFTWDDAARMLIATTRRATAPSSPTES